MIEWTVAPIGAAGVASSTLVAWQDGLDAAVAAAPTISGPLTVTVAGSTALLYPGQDPEGRYNPADTRAAADRLLADIQAEQPDH